MYKYCLKWDYGGLWRTLSFNTARCITADWVHLWQSFLIVQSRNYRKLMQMKLLLSALGSSLAPGCQLMSHHFKSLWGCVQRICILCTSWSCSFSCNNKYIYAGKTDRSSIPSINDKPVLRYVFVQQGLQARCVKLNIQCLSNPLTLFTL